MNTAMVGHVAQNGLGMVVDWMISAFGAVLGGNMNGMTTQAIGQVAIAYFEQFHNPIPTATCIHSGQNTNA